MKMKMYPQKLFIAHSTAHFSVALQFIQTFIEFMANSFDLLYMNYRIV